jgi:hypothetical protein
VDSVDFGWSVVQNERWADLPNGHEVSDLGRFRRHGKPKGTWPTSRGYLSIEIQRGKKHRAHRLVYEAFNGPIPDGLFVDHVNGVKTDNRLSNLEVVTHQENMNRAKALGRFKGYTGTGTRPRIGPEEKAEILTLREGGASWPEMARRTGRSQSALQRIVYAARDAVR